MFTTIEASSTRVTTRPVLDRAVAAMSARRRAEVECVTTDPVTPRPRPGTDPDHSAQHRRP